MKPRKPKSFFLQALSASSAIVGLFSESSHAIEIEAMGKSLLAVLGTPKVFKKTLEDTTIYYSKDKNGKPDKVAFIEKNVYPPSCSHTWIVGVSANGAVTQVRAQEMSCPHAFPAKQSSFLDQYKGKGPVDTAKIKDGVHTIAKATGSCDLASDAVVHSITTYQKIKGQL